MLGLLAIALGLVLALSHHEQRRSGSNGVWPTEGVGSGGQGLQACQEGELLPAGTSALQLLMQSAETPGPVVSVVLRRHGRVIARSSVTPDAEGTSFTAPIARTTRDLDDVQVCLTVGDGPPVALIGGPPPPHVGRVRVGGELLPAALPITYLRQGEESWWSYASAVVARMGLGRGDWGGRWIAWLTGALLLAAVALVVRATLRTVVAERAEPTVPAGDAVSAAAPGGRLRQVPATAWTIAVVAVLNAAAWSLITPAFQVPDEQTHIAYAQLIGERGRPPIPREREQLAPELQTIMGDLRFGTPEVRSYDVAIWSPLQQRRLDRDLHASLARHAGDEAGPAAPEPPLYYALEAIPYRLASGATLLDRIAFMRLLSALMAGVTALFAFLFVRECLPGRPWAWTVGALGVALTPTLGFVSGGVNPDALLFAVCAALFYTLAVAFRRGLTTRLAVWIGVVLALGIVGKINFYGIVPGALVALALAARASTGGWNRGAARLVGIAAAIAVAPYLLLTLLDTLAWDRTFILARTPAEAPEDHGDLMGQLSYLWQVFLPRLPGQAAAFPEQSPVYELWFKGFVGRFGWLTTTFAHWVYRVAAVLFCVTGALALRALLADRATLRRRAPELVGYAAMAGGLLLLIGMVALRGWAPGIVGAVQGRYLLPLLPLFGALLVLAARGAGDRWGRTVGTGIVVLCVAWSLFAQLVTIEWFYG